jgi:translocator protein
VKLSSVAVFLGAYAVFLIAGFAFRIDRQWYDALVKPSWTPSGAMIGVIWTVLFACIALSLALLDREVGILNVGVWLLAAIVANWFFNQAFSFFQVAQKDWLLAGVDAALVALTSFAVAALAWRINRASALLYVPYALWSTFATYLSFLIWSLNR